MLIYPQIKMYQYTTDFHHQKPILPDFCSFISPNLSAQIPAISYLDPKSGKVLMLSAKNLSPLFVLFDKESEKFVNGGSIDSSLRLDFDSWIPAATNCQVHHQRPDIMEIKASVTLETQTQGRGSYHWFSNCIGNSRIMLMNIRSKKALIQRSGQISKGEPFEGDCYVARDFRKTTLPDGKIVEFLLFIGQAYASNIPRDKDLEKAKYLLTKGKKMTGIFWKSLCMKTMKMFCASHSEYFSEQRNRKKMSSEIGK